MSVEHYIIELLDRAGILHLEYDSKQIPVKTMMVFTSNFFKSYCTQIYIREEAWNRFYRTLNMLLVD